MGTWESDESREYEVSWSMTVDATSAEEAARQARDTIRAFGSTAHVFEVTHPNGTGLPVQIDLNYPDERHPESATVIVPHDFAVQPLTPAEIATATEPAECGTCGRWWDDGIITAYTPVPAGRCPFEWWH